MRVQTGTWAVLALLLVAVIFIKQEGSQTQISPVFVLAPKQQLYVKLCGGYFCDKESCVIGAADSTELASKIMQNVVGEDARLLVSNWLSVNQLASGYKFKIVKKSDQQLHVDCDFMSATKRITLGIPLNPDHMTKMDWQAIPGVGDKLANAIIADRCAKGNFGSLSALSRVHGISDKKLQSMRQYF